MKIALLGPLEVRTGSGDLLELPGARLRLLLILLALDAGRVVPTPRLVDGVWAGDPPAGAVNALQALVSRLRRGLPDGSVESVPSGYRLAVAAEAVDAVRFDALVARGRREADRRRAVALLREAGDLWRGPALLDAGEAEFARAPRARLEELRLTAIEERVWRQLSDDPPEDAAGLLAELAALVAEYPLRERLAGLQMRALRAAGRPADALAVYARIRETLAERLGTDPSPSLAALHLDLLRDLPPRTERRSVPPTPPATAPPAIALPTAAAFPASAPPAAAPSHRGQSSSAEGGPATNLRSSLTSFVGRDEEIGRVGGYVAEFRLTTLTGPGGAGKTRLAGESGHRLLDRFPDGVWLVELAPVTDPAEVVPAVLAALNLREQALVGSRGRPPGPDGGDAVARLIHALRLRRALLILDNCEHVVTAAADLAERLLGDCPGLRILATSREPLGVTGEALLPVEPLGSPPVGADPVTALGFPSVRLLADRAGAVRPGFTVDVSTVEPVIRICRALDGMPLAIELAAARMSALPPRQVADRLDDRFRLLTRGSRTALPRHQTLRAVVDWSWDLLDEPDRIVLRRLAVFVGGSDVEATVEVVGADPPACEDSLATLIDKSLLVAIPGPDRPRYRMLETIRAYGLDRLADADERERIERAHGRYFLALAEAAGPKLLTGDQLRWLRRLDDDDDNLNAALRRAIANRDADTAVRMVAALGWYWWLRGRRMEGAELAADAIDLDGPAPTDARAMAYGLAALNGFDSQFDLERVKDWFRSSMELSRQTTGDYPLLRVIPALAALVFAQTRADVTAPLFDDPDPWLGAFARLLHGFTQLNTGQPSAAAEEHLTLALATFRGLGERWGTYFALTATAELLARRGEHARAAAHYEESLEQFEVLGSAEDRSLTAVRLAQELVLLGRRADAEARLTEAAHAARRAGAADSLAHVEYARGELARQDGDRAEARRRLELALEILAGRRVSPQLRGFVHSGLGYLDAADGDLESARVRHRSALAQCLASGDAPAVAQALVGMADLALAEADPARAATLLATAEAVRGGPDETLPDTPRVTEAARAELGEPEFTNAYARGSKSTMDTVRELATSDGAAPGPPTGR